MSHHDELPSIDPSDLDNITGGVTAPSASTGTNSQLSTALQGITSQIASLSNNKSNTGSSMSSLLPMMLMLGKGGGGGACPCGCGMANCMRR